MRRRQIIIAILGLVVGLGLIILILSPRVTEWKPKDGTVSRGRPITLGFNRPVNLESLEAHLTIHPLVDGELLQQGREYQFFPKIPLSYGQSYTITISPGIRGKHGLPSLVGDEMVFSVLNPQLIFVRAEDEKHDIWRAENDGEPQRVTNEVNGIWDYSVIPDGSGLLFSSVDIDGSHNLVFIDLFGERRNLLNCEDDQCRSAEWQPNGTLVAYERQELKGLSNETQIWLLDTLDDRTWPIDEKELLATVELDDSKGQYPQWSADGRYLSYFKPEARVIVVLDMEGGRSTIIPANMDLMGEWSPTNHQFAYTELVLGQLEHQEHDDEISDFTESSGPSLFSHLIIADMILETSSDISEGQEIDESRPSWNPEGTLLAIGRSGVGGGRQIWLVDMDTGESKFLTDDPTFNHSAIAWSPDGKSLAFMRTAIDGTTQPSTWILDLESGQMFLFEENAIWPNWLP